MKRAVIALIAICLAVCGVFLGLHLTSYYVEEEEQRESFEALRQIVVSPERISAPEKEPQPDILSLRERNPECVGWIRIQDTVIDYPVMQSAQEPEYYLKHDFDGGESSHGVPFVDTRCSMRDSDNLIVYGHQMHDETMFSPLLSYEDEAFLREHPEIELYTMDGKAIYRVFAVLPATGTIRPENGWSIFNSIEFTASSFAETIFNCKERSVVPAESEPAYGDKLLTLVTCEYSQENGRLAVVAYKI